MAASVRGLVAAAPGLALALFAGCGRFSLDGASDAGGDGGNGGASGGGANGAGANGGGSGGAAPGERDGGGGAEAGPGPEPVPGCPRPQLDPPVELFQGRYRVVDAAWAGDRFAVLGGEGLFRIPRTVSQLQALSPTGDLLAMTDCCEADWMTVAGAGNRFAWLQYSDFRGPVYRLVGLDLRPVRDDVRLPDAVPPYQTPLLAWNGSMLGVLPSAYATLLVFPPDGDLGPGGAPREVALVEPGGTSPGSSWTVEGRPFVGTDDGFAIAHAPVSATGPSGDFFVSRVRLSNGSVDITHTSVGAARAAALAWDPVGHKLLVATAGDSIRLYDDSQNGAPTELAPAGLDGATIDVAVLAAPGQPSVPVVAWSTPSDDGVRISIGGRPPSLTIKRQEHRNVVRVWVVAGRDSVGIFVWEATFADTPGGTESSRYYRLRCF